MREVKKKKHYFEQVAKEGDRNRYLQEKRQEKLEYNRINEKQQIK